jgi:hypothetical protein
MKPPATCARVEAEIEDLPRFSRPELVVRWRKLHGAEPPKGISRALLIRAIAFATQAKRYGGLKPAVARQLHKVADGPSSGKEAKAGTSPKLRPGTRLVREWNGSTHMVEVVDGGFVWNGERHRSLSVIARTITGARWSGPRFFGLSPGGAP